MSRRPLLLAAAALACAATARPAAAQSVPPTTATATASVAAGDGAPLASATQLAAGPSRLDRASTDVAERAAALRRELRSATMERRSGQALVLAGGVGLGAAYAGYVGSGAMGMNGGQAALFAGGSAVLAGGITRWVSGRHRAERAQARSVGAGRR